VSSEELAYLTPEARARVEIDRMLGAAGWSVQDVRAVNLAASRGVAVRELVLRPPHGRADYLLFADGRPAGIVEAKPEGDTLTGVEWQSARYAEGLPDELEPAVEGGLPFVYESTGTETRFTNRLDPDYASRDVFSFHRPETMAGWLDELRRHPTAPTLRHRLRGMPALTPDGLRPAQFTAIGNLERSLAANRPKALIQMATGAGKTMTAASVAYRLVKHADARRILFLVDRATLGKQTLKEFQGFTTPDDGRKLTELYNVQHLRSQRVDPVSRVTISTIQRIYSILRGDPELDEEADEVSLDELATEPLPVEYSAALPPETFDVVIVDECHRSIYGVWRQVLDYFDAFTIGLTATPNKQAFGFFDQNLVMEYGHEQAVVDRVNVPFDVYRIRTQITEAGSTIDAGLWTEFRERKTRRSRWEQLDEDLSYTATQLDRQVVSRDQIRTVLETFRDRLFTEIFPGRREVPKTLIFAKDDAHADEIVQLAREVFGKGNEFAAKITHKARNAEQLIATFRNSYDPRIAVTVDMIATGTDVKPLECVFFMRSVRSRTYFEQMKGRGVRTIDETSFRDVTPDAEAKERFVIVDAVGVTESDLVDTVPLDRKPTLPLERLLRQVSFAVHNPDPDTCSALAARLARLDGRLGKDERAELEDLADGRSLQELTRGILDALDPDVQLALAKDASGTATPTVDMIAEAARTLLSRAVGPLASNPALRERIVEVRRLHEVAIDETSADEVLEAGYSAEAADRARQTVESWEHFCEEHRDEITALRILYNARGLSPKGTVPGFRLTFGQIRELAQAIGKPPHQWTPERLWEAYEALDHSKVRGSGARVLTDLVSLVRVALHQEDELVSYPDLVRERFHAWLLTQENAGRAFTGEQLAWLERIRDHVSAALAISTDDFGYTPFVEAGGLGRAAQVFGDDLAPLLDELNEALAA